MLVRFAKSVSIVTLALATAGVAQAQVADGSYAVIPGTPPAPPPTALDSALAAYQSTSATLITSALTADNTAALQAYQAAELADFNASAALAQVNTDLTKAQTAYATAQANTVAASALVTNVSTALAGAQTNLAAQQATLAGLTSASPGYAAQVQAVADAQAQVSALQAASTSANASLTAANTAQSTALANQTAAQQAQITATAAAASAATTLSSATSTLNLGLSSNTALSSAITSYNSVTTGPTVSANITSLQALLDPTSGGTATTPGDGGYARTKSLLTAAASSAQQNISLASAALTGDAAATSIGAHFETEVLGALVNHEGRITQNTADIAANTAAISAETTARIAADTAETNARIAGDAALRTDLTAETNARVAANRELRDRIASSTATAIALGGTAILPDTNFTLAGNVGFYQGAQAVALNAAARVGPHTYVTAAGGGGLNKHGEFGGRVGFVFGF
jgi:hypothetical protein